MCHAALEQRLIYQKQKSAGFWQCEVSHPAGRLKNCSKRACSSAFSGVWNVPRFLRSPVFKVCLSPLWSIFLLGLVEQFLDPLLQRFEFAFVLLVEFLVGLLQLVEGL